MGTNKVKEIRGQFFDKISTLIISAFGLVAALAWNESITSIFKNYYQNSGGIIANLIYAIVVTAIAVIATIWISSLATKQETKKPETKKCP